jgi:hypothetical protein
VIPYSVVLLDATVKSDDRCTQATVCSGGGLWSNSHEIRKHHFNLGATNNQSVIDIWEYAR